MIARFADAAARLGTATLTVQPQYIRFAAQHLRGSGVLVGREWG
jgi:deoxyribose-phosphate aldolase